MEKLLEESAKARRAAFGAEPSLPNPMRARLHEEISRTALEKAESGESPAGFFQWWPRLALVAAVVLLAVALPIFRARNEPGGVAAARPMAMQENRKLDAPAELSDEAKVALAPPVAGAISGVKPPAGEALGGVAEAPAQGNSFAQADTKETDALSSITPPPESPDTLKKFADVEIQAKPALQAAKALRTEEGLSKGSMAPVTAAAAAPAAPAGKVESANATGRFSRNLVKQAAQFNSNLKQTTHVLNSFQLEQNGSHIRVVDADGSTYTGRIEPLGRNDSRNTRQRNQSYAPADKDEAESGTEYYFRASGFNGSLKKRVVFEGNYIANEPAAAEITSRGTKAKAESNQEQVTARIIGTAKINGESPVPVDAVSVER